MSGALVGLLGRMQAQSDGSASGTTTLVPAPPPEIAAVRLKAAEELQKHLKTKYGQGWNSKTPLITLATDAVSARDILLGFESTAVTVIGNLAQEAVVKKNPLLAQKPTFEVDFPDEGTYASKTGFKPLSRPADSGDISPLEAVLNAYVRDPSTEDLPMITAETRATFHHIYKMRWTVNWVILSMLVDGVNEHHAPVYQKVVYLRVFFRSI